VARLLFVDSTFLVARYDRDDKFHDRAKRFMEATAADRRQRVRLVLNDYIFDEVITTLLRRTRRHEVARTAGEIIRGSRTTETLPVPRGMLERAWALFVSRPDKLWSFTDCVAFVMMKDLRLTSALTFDHNFEEAGFAALP
jgi:uncharacterized protein